MKIGGFLKNSLIDFPKTVACVVFTSGCNFICPYCHNPELVAGNNKKSDGLIDDNEIFSFLKKRKGLIDGVVISGGEPCLQKDLYNFCFKLKNLGVKIKLDSNGSMPDVLENLIDNNLLDFIAIDIKTDLDNYYLASGKDFNVSLILKSINMVKSSGVLYEFRTTCVKPFINKAIMQNIGTMVDGAQHYILQKCSSNVDVLDPEFVKTKDNMLLEEQILDLKQIIDPFVEKCSVR